MQPMPNKSRTAVLVGAAVLAVVIGAVALYNSNRNADPMQSAEDPYMLEEANAASSAAPVTTPADPGAQPTTSRAPLTEGTTMTLPGSAAAPTGVPASPATSASVPESGATLKVTDAAVPATHTVQVNDTLSNISHKYYGDSVFAGDIEAANQLTDPDHLAVGTELKLPRPSEILAMTTSNN